MAFEEFKDNYEKTYKNRIEEPLPEKTDESAFSEFKKNYESNKKNEETFFGRGIARTGARAVETVLKAGEFVNQATPLEIVKNQISKHFNTEKQKKPSELVRENLSRATEGYTEPQSPSEQKYDEAVELFTNLALPTPGVRFKTAEGLLRAWLGTGAGIGAEELTKILGGGETAQVIAKTIFSIIPMIFKGQLNPNEKEIKKISWCFR